jgi:hypothetical protein
VDVPSAALPLLTAAAAAVFAARIAGSAVRRFSPSKVLWALGLLLAAAGAGAEAYGVADGWGEAAFRVYYLAGGCLTVAFLGAGSAFLVLPRSLALVVLGALATSVVGATVGVLVADLDPALLAAAPDERPPDNETITGHAFLWAAAMNSIGSLLLIGGSLWSMARRVRVAANALIVLGVLAVAGSGTLTAFGSYRFVYVGQTVGLFLMLAGFELAEARGRGRRRRPAGLGLRAPG